MTISAQPKARYAQRISKVLDYIATHLDEDLSVDALCGVANFSRFHFHRQFTAYTGVSVSRLVLLMRLRRAAMQLAFARDLSVTDVAFGAGFANAESFSRAFRKECGQSPSGFRKTPTWQQWQVRMTFSNPQVPPDMQVEIVDFPETMVAALEHRGPQHLSYETSQKFIEWRRANDIRPDQGRTYGIHHLEHGGESPEDFRLELCVSVDKPVADNPQGVVTRIIPAGRCARVRNLGSRHELAGPRYLYETWLPGSAEQLRDHPIFFHYVNVGPGVRDEDMITDIYLPLL
jgi:AraC family transcriptional regulator